MARVYAEGNLIKQTPSINYANKTINLKGIEITIVKSGDLEFISLTEMLITKDGYFFISDWLRNRNRVEFIGTWESVYDPNFNYTEFGTIKTQTGLP